MQPGDTVLDLACGTGLNFPLNQKHIGPSGLIIGIDMTDAILDQAQKRVTKAGWENISLHNQDASFYEPDSKVNAVISTYGLSLIPNIRQVIYNIEKMLVTNGSLVILELQIQNTWPNWFSDLVVNLMKPFAITDVWLINRPWETIVDTITELFDGVEISQHYFSLGYIISGHKRL